MRPRATAQHTRLRCIATLGAAFVLETAGAAAIQAQDTTTRVPPPGSQLGIVNRRGAANVVAGLPDSLYYSDPAVSPDGRTIAVAASVQRGNTSASSLAGVIAAARAAGPPSGTQIYLFTLPDGPLVKVSSGMRDLLPQWVPGRNEISFVRRSTTGDTTATLVIRGAGADGTERVAFSLPFLSTVTWFPDGQRVVAAIGGTVGMPEGRLYIVPVDDPGSATQIVNDKLVKTRPRLNHDGTMLVYEGAEVNISASGLLRAGSSRVFVHRLADGAVASIAGGTSENPVWSSTGTEIHFQSLTGAMYSAGVRTGRALSIDTPRLLSDFRLETAASSFAVLPGDSLWLVRMPRVRPAVAEVPANVRGKRASTGEQRSIEFVAAREIVTIAEQSGLAFDKHGLDSRAYALAGDPPFAGYSDTLKAYNLPSHIAGHNRAIGNILKVAGVLPVEGGCLSNRPQGCRSGNYPGLVAFSPAIVSADSARISVYRTLDGIGLAGGTSPSASIVTWRITLVRKGSEWTIRTVTRFP
jgi:hypothetical protein